MRTTAIRPARELASITTGAKVSRDKLELARAMRAKPTEAEARAWSMLRGRGVHGLKFRRQQPIRGFIADFYCSSLRLVVELDGPMHQDDGVRSVDEARDQVFASLGLRVLRVSNEDLTRAHLEALLRPFVTSPPNPLSLAGEGARDDARSVLLPLAREGEGAGG